MSALVRPLFSPTVTFWACARLPSTAGGAQLSSRAFHGAEVRPVDQHAIVGFRHLSQIGVPSNSLLSTDTNFVAAGAVAPDPLLPPPLHHRTAPRQHRADILELASSNRPDHRVWPSGINTT